MTATLRLDASANQTFRLSLSLAAFVRTTPLDGVAFHMDARRAGSSPSAPPAFRWATSGATGLIQVDELRAYIVLLAALKDFRGLAGKYDFDLRAELPSGGSELLAKGLLVVARGVTTNPSDATSASVIGVGDTVMVTVDSASQPAALPMSMSKVLLAADAARADAQLAAAAAQAAAAALTPAALSAAMRGMPRADRAALAQDLIAALADLSHGEDVAPSGQACWNGSGFLVKAQ